MQTNDDSIELYMSSKSELEEPAGDDQDAVRKIVTATEDLMTD